MTSREICQFVQLLVQCEHDKRKTWAKVAKFFDMPEASVYNVSTLKFEPMMSTIEPILKKKGYIPVLLGL